MTTKEFSNSFDTLLNSYSQRASFGEGNLKQDIVLDEYEKSQFLTEAQEQIVISYYNGHNSTLDSFEKTEEIRRYLSSLIQTAELSPIEYEGKLLSENSQVFSLPNALWFITYESAKLGSSTDSCLNDKEVQVVPVTQDEYYRTNENPFKGPGFRRALRLDISGNKVEIVSKYTISKYLVRYINKINPIILEPLSDGLSINGETTEQTCSLHESLHKPILELAVKLALQSKGIQLQ